MNKKNTKNFLLLFGDEYKDKTELEKEPKSLELIDFIENLGFEFHSVPSTNYDYDGVLVCNNPKIDKLQLSVRKGNVFCLMQEPGHRILHNFMYKNLDQYDVVFSTVLSAKNVKISNPYLGSYINKTTEELNKISLPIKTKLLSCIMSDNISLPGHRKRLSFLNKLKKQISIDHFGKGFNYIESKEEGLLNYCYSIAMENASKDYYFSEKINDCFICYTIPIYYGCTNIDKFYPPQSYISINPNDTKGALKIIQEQLGPEDYKNRLSYLLEARDLAIKKYNYNSFIRNDIMPIVKKNDSMPYVKYTLASTKPSILSKMVTALKFVKIAKKLKKILSLINLNYKF